MSGPQLKQQHLHHYVMQYITGASQARLLAKPTLKFGAVVAASSSLLIIGFAALNDSFNKDVFGLALGVLVAGVPVGAFAQRITMGISFKRDQLRLTRFMIGRKPYIAPKKQVLNDNADLFSVALSMACRVPFLTPNKQAAAWHTYKIIEDLPGVGVLIGWFGTSKHPYAFMYGDPSAILENADDVWDLGHSRKIGQTDRDEYKQTLANWKRQNLTSLALAFTPLKDNQAHLKLSAQDLARDSTIIGLAGLEGSRDYGKPFPLASAEAVRSSSIISASVAIGLSVLALFSVIANAYNGTSLVFGIWSVLIIKLLAETMPLATFSWDHAAKTNKLSSKPITEALWNGVIMGGLSFGAFLTYLSFNNSLGAEQGSPMHHIAIAVSIIAFGFSLLALTSLARNYPKTIDRLQLKNPLYLLGAASSMLVVLILAYANGPLLLDGIILGLSTAGLFVLLHEIRTYANLHHSRENIIELLKSLD